eukprot:PITA_14326
MGWEIHQMDVKTTFLNKVIEEEVYMEQPEGFETHEKRTHACRLKKAMYGLKQAPRAWVGSLAEKWGDLPWARKICYRYYEEIQNAGLSTHGYSHDHNWKKIDASRDKEVDPTLYIQLIGSLMYLVNTKSDICFAVNTLSQFMVEPKRVHWAAARHMLRYVHGIVEYGFKYSRGEDVKLNGFTDAHWAGRLVDRKCPSGHCFNVGSRMISWCSRKQKLAALSSSEAEYMAASATTCETIWFRKLLVSLFKKRMEAAKVYCDNHICIKLS